MAALALALLAALGAWRVATYARAFNDEMQLPDPALARAEPAIVEPRTPRLSQRVILVMVDGLRLDHARLSGYDTMRATGVDGAARSHYPTVSRPNYVTLLTGVPPRASGIRANRVRTPIRLDSIMTRVRAAGLRVVTASDIGNVPPLFVTTLDEVGDPIQVGDLVTPPPGQAWPFDEVRTAESLVELERSLATVLSTPSDLVIVLAGDVDRAGHAFGAASPAYRDAATAIGEALDRLLARLDPTRDTLIVTADHGHVDRGGHGGTEPETTAVPLLLAGAGVVPGAQAPTARLVDVAPTISALLGIPAPGHGHGRALVELLQLSPADARSRATDDATRLAAVRAMPADPPSRDVTLLMLTTLALALAITLAIALRPAIAMTRGTWVGVLAFACVIAALVAACRGRMSPSEVPALWRLQRLLAVCGTAAVAIQLVASWHVARAFANRLSISNGISLVALSISLGSVYIVRGYFAVPRVDVPEPFWLVAMPAIEIAAAVSCVAVFAHLIVELIRSLRGTDDHAH